MTHYAYYLFGKDLQQVKLTELKKQGITDILLNYYAITLHGKTKIEQWIAQAKKQGINVHIWCQCFYRNGKWINPKKTDTSKIIKEIVGYSKIKGVKGINLDYLRYTGDAYKTKGGAEAITKFVKTVKKNIPKGVQLSCSVMAEKENKYYYGQDIAELSKTADIIIPMAYKGNYKGNTKWLQDITTYFNKTCKCNIWTALQTYKSDTNPTKLTTKELKNDTKTVIQKGSKGIVLFRYGLCPAISF